MKKNLIFYPILLFCVLFSAELVTRLHHFYCYGLFFPVVKGIIHYDSELMKKTAERKNVSPEFKLDTIDADLILSGGSVAWGYGLPSQLRPGNLLSTLEQDIKILDLSLPGIFLQDEIRRASSVASLPPLMVFVSGFNDCSFSVAHRLRNRLVSGVLKKIPVLEYSLFFLKCLYRIALVFSGLKAGKEIFLEDELKQLKRLIQKNPQTKFLFLMQPYLSQQKKLTIREKELLDLFRVRVNSRFLARRKELVSKLALVEHLEVQDLQERFLEANELFIDCCHLTESGNLLLVNLIREKLSQDGLSNIHFTLE
jgi:hypothetical protein